MSSEIIGTKFKYTVDTSHGMNRDGFIAIGTESIVYKGLKTADDGSLQFSCVLKFKPRYVSLNGAKIDRVRVFKEELEIFEDLQECRSIVRIFDVIENLGDFSLPCDKVKSRVINAAGYFCVVEEYIDGWSLEEYCRQERWKLRKTVQLENKLSKVINYHEYTDEEKDVVNLSYYKNYDNILKYQSEMFQFMINLCEILEFVTEKKNVLHLDVKPENIMVTKYGKELVLIDFGRAKRITKANRFAAGVLEKVNYDGEESVEKMYQHGTLGYAAPECYAEAADGSRFPFKQHFEPGKMSVESDIFSFGATFWECLNIFELVTQSEEFAGESHDFYRKHFLNDVPYCNRDLTLTSLHYHKKLENIIKKCTRERNADYLNPDNDDFYHSYRTLKKDIEEARNSAPTIVRAENIKVRNAFATFGVMLATCATFLLISVIYRAVGFRIAREKWDSLTADYNVTQFYKLKTVANDLMETTPSGRMDETYSMIAKFTYSDGGIDEQEASMLLELLKDMSASEHMGQYIDEIMQYANTKKFKEISTDIVKLGVEYDCVGYELAKAIYNAEVGKTEIIGAYETLKKHRDDSQFKNAVIKLKNVLDNDESIRMISEHEDTVRSEIQEFLKGVR